MPSVALTVPRLFQGRARYRCARSDLAPAHWTPGFRIGKATFDIALSLLALPLIAVVTLLLALVNPWLNPGPVFFRQKRLGRHRRPFLVWKFRTMICAPQSAGAAARGADDGLEQDRITPLGRVLRQMRIDELPNFLNVLQGEMSVIGPRPDTCLHAERYLATIPHYAFRYLVRPGITGLAQIEAGYAEGIAATARKAAYDQHYIETSCGKLDLWIAWRTAFVVMRGEGAK